jgi:hypothetical protein
MSCTHSLSDGELTAPATVVDQWTGSPIGWQFATLTESGAFLDRSTNGDPRITPVSSSSAVVNPTPTATGAVGPTGSSPNVTVSENTTASGPGPENTSAANKFGMGESAFLVVAGAAAFNAFSLWYM